jgi:hypothetical protein
MRIVNGLRGLVLGACVLAPAVAGAQDVSAGVKLGVDFTTLGNARELIDNVVGKTSVDSSSKVGVIGGGFVQFPIRDRLAFQPELLFVQKGVKLDEIGGGSLSASLNYLEFPMLLRVTFPMEKQNAYVLVGPSFGIKASTSATLDSAGQTKDENIDGSVRSADFGLALGLGVERNKYFLEIRYTLGLNDIATDLPGGGTTTPHVDSVKNRVFAIMVGLKLK